MAQLPRITISIDWSGSTYQYAPPRVTVTANDWQNQVARVLLTALKTMEAGDTNTVAVVPSAVTPETVGKIVVNGTDEYAYTVVDSEVTEVD